MGGAGDAVTVSQGAPCHHIPLNEVGETIEMLEGEDNQRKMEEAVKSWLKERISLIEKERSLSSADERAVLSSREHV